MHNANIPDYTELPSNKRLFKSTIIAIISAVVILVTIVLPAEYGIDPTGIGSMTGLKRMGEIKTALAEELEADQQGAGEAADAVVTSQIEEVAPAIGQGVSGLRTDTMAVTISANESTEIKLTMDKHTSVEFTWSSDAGNVFYDLHGDSKEINYHIYEKGTESSRQGTLLAAFNGKHGWYWKNRTTSPITITLITTGNYIDIKEMK